MKVRGLKNFTGVKPSGGFMPVMKGRVVEMPEGVDWLRAGLVVEADDEDVSRETFRNGLDMLSKDELIELAAERNVKADRRMRRSTLINKLTA